MRTLYLLDQYRRPVLRKNFLGMRVLCSIFSTHAVFTSAQLMHPKLEQYNRWFDLIHCHVYIALVVQNPMSLLFTFFLLSQPCFLLLLSYSAQFYFLIKRRLYSLVFICFASRLNIKFKMECNITNKYLRCIFYLKTINNSTNDCCSNNKSNQYKLFPDSADNQDWCRNTC